jgi:RNA recognition motif-containing protein
VKRAQARCVAQPSIHHGKREHTGGVSGGNKDERPEQLTEHLQNKVFVGGIPPNIDRDELKRIVEQFAVVDAIFIHHDGSSATMIKRIWFCHL